MHSFFPLHPVPAAFGIARPTRHGQVEPRLQVVSDWQYGHTGKTCVDIPKVISGPKSFPTLFPTLLLPPPIPLQTGITISRILGSGAMSEDTTLRGLLKSLCIELREAYRRETAAMTMNVDRELESRQRELAQLEEHAAEQDADVAPEEYEAFHLLKQERDFATSIHDTLPDLTAEFHQVRGQSLELRAAASLPPRA